MIIDKKLDASVYYFLKDLFSATPFINVVDGFPEEGLVLPTIAVEINEIDTYPFEIGSRVRGKIRLWNIDIFAADKNQRDEYAYNIMSALENNIPVYNYDEGFPPISTPSRIGAIDVTDVTLKIIKVLPQLTEKMYYRSLVSFAGEYNSA